jgi:hypothetical protein
MNGDQFEVGDRVVVTGGYDYEPAWLRGGDGYIGTIVELDGSVAVVEVDEEITLDGSWEDFGEGAAQALRTVLRMADSDRARRQISGLRNRASGSLNQGRHLRRQRHRSRRLQRRPAHQWSVAAANVGLKGSAECWLYWRHMDG